MNFLRVNTLKHQVAKSLNNENLFLNQKNIKKNMNKSTVSNAATFRQFGKDISNYGGLTVSTNEFPSCYNKKKSDLIVKHGKQKRISNKNCLLQKLKNYNIKQKQKTNNVKSLILPINEINKKLPLVTSTEMITECNCITMDVDEEKSSLMKSCEANLNVIPNEILNMINVQQCDEYIEDIFSHLKKIELNYLAKSDYMSKQIDINEKMRGILLDWLVEVHLKFKLFSETLFLTVNIIDRYLEKTNINRTKLQLVGVTAMFIACKYEEIYSPEVKDFIYMTDKAYTKGEMLKMESDILGALEYNVTVPSSLRYLELYQKHLGLSEIEVMYCKYLIEMCLMEYKFLKYNPSLIASCSMLISMGLHCKNISDLLTISGYELELLRNCSNDIISMIEKADVASLQAVRKKYYLSKYNEVSKIKITNFHFVSLITIK